MMQTYQTATNKSTKHSDFSNGKAKCNKGPCRRVWTNAYMFSNEWAHKHHGKGAFNFVIPLIKYN